RGLLKHQGALAAQGVPVGALYHHVDPLADVVERAAGKPRASLEAFNVAKDGWRVVNSFADAVLEETLTPSSWAHYGPLPSGIDGLRQTQVVGAIVESSEQGRVVEV
ncbi:MAG: hypothetical protein J7M39_12350, partial [Anaerolineae bacterium]|nr:hypothetical protein [Anaerolineae bacterium]